MFRPTRCFLFLLVVLLMLAACSKDEKAATTTAANTDPAAAIMNQVKLLKADKIGELVKASLPPDDYQGVRREFAEQQHKPVTEEQRQEFAKQMRELSAPDAEQALFNKLLPVLNQYDSKYKAMLPMYIGIGQTAITTGINQSKDMTPEQKKQATEMLSAAAAWAQGTNWGDREKAKQAIAVVTSTVRKLDVKTLDQARALNFDQAMRKYGEAWNGVRKVLAVYGVDVDKALDSVKTKTVSQTGDKATVQVSYTVFDKPMQSTVEMVERDGHWYNASLLAKVEKSLTEQQQAATAASAAPATPATRAGGTPAKAGSAR